MEKTVVEKITSPDGTPIAFQRSGSGPPLVLVPGAGAANPMAWPVVRVLRQHFTLYAVDRRGHGASGDAPAYAIEREYEDIAAVIGSIGAPAALLGHSFGGLCALGAALLTPHVRQLVVYESFEAISSNEAANLETYLQRLEALLEAGDREQALLEFYRDFARLTPAEIEQLSASPAWPERVATASTLPRELRANLQFSVEPDRLRGLQTPVLLLTGGDSPPATHAGMVALHAALPNSRVVMMPGQEHVAMYTAPDLFLTELLAFFKLSD